MNLIHTIGNLSYLINNNKHCFRNKMAYNIEIKQKSKDLECELFQKRYEVQKKSEKSKEEINLLTSWLNELKQNVCKQVAYNKELTKKCIQQNK